MTELNKRIADIEIPHRMRGLRVSDEGYPVPWFVPWVNNKPEFRGMDGEKFMVAVRHKRCWLCGEPLGKYMTFVIGPMCAVNKNTAEPPCHHDCAIYAVEACPFLTQPKMRRNEKDAPWLQEEEDKRVAGIMIRRNPGVTCLWTSLSYRTVKVAGGSGILFRLDDPVRLEFFAESRRATYAEITFSISTGLPALLREAEKDGQEAVNELHKMVEDAVKLIPKVPEYASNTRDS